MSAGLGPAERRSRLRARHFQPAFNLVELVIVIVILSVLAAIAVPRLAGGSLVRSREASLVQDLAVLRRAIETYSGEHDGAFPGAKADGIGGGANSPEALLSQLTKFSTAAGAVSDTADNVYRYGPYLQNIPTVPVGPTRGSRTVAIDDLNSPPLVAGGTEGWVYNPLTGGIIANTDDANSDGSRAYDEY